MPYTRKVGQTPNAAEASSPPEQSGFAKLRGWLGTGIRLGSGFVANAGGLPGAAAGGGGELLAEAVEGSLGKDSWKRAGVEAAIGAIPLGKTFSAGRALKSAAKGAGFNAAGDVMRQGAEGNFSEGGAGWDAKRTGYATAGGGLLGALFGKFAPGMAPEALDEATRLQKANEARAKAGQKISLPTESAATSRGFNKLDAVADYNSQRQSQAPRIPGRPATANPNVHPPIPKGNATQFDKLERMFTHAMGDRQRRVDFEQKLSDRFDAADVRADAKHLEYLDEAARNKAAQDELNVMKEGRVKQEPTSINETISATTPTGRESATTKWVTPDPEDLDGTGGGRTSGGGSKSPRNGITLDVAREEAIAAGMAQPEGSPSRLFAEWLVASPNMSFKEAEAAVKTGARPIPPQRVTSVTGVTPSAKFAGMQDDGAGGQFPLYTIEGGPAHGSTVSAAGLEKYGIVVPEDAGLIDSRVNVNTTPSDARMSELLDKLGGKGPNAAPSVPPAVAKPGPKFPPQGPNELAKLLNAEIDNPGVQEATVGRNPWKFDSTTGVTDDIPFGQAGGQGQNWVDEQLDYIKWLESEQDPSKFGGRGKKAPVVPGAPPKASKMVPASTEEQGLTDLLNFLGVDDAYAKGDAAFRKDIGGVYGRQKAQAMASNSPEAVVGKTAKGKGKGGILGSESGKGGMFGSGSETGAINPELLSTIAGGSIGGLVDAAWGDDSNPLEGILAGAALGGGIAAAPKILEMVGKGPETLRTPEGRKMVAEEFVNSIPQFQRFAYLSDARGLLVNAIVGPYGAALTGAIEAILSGDQRGWALLKEVRNPLNFLKEMHTKENFNESMRLLAEGELGRAEGLPFKLVKGVPKDLQEGLSTFKTGMSMPGVYMSMGDLQARRMLQRAGFTPDEARQMTLTAEPRTATGKDITNLGRSGSPIMNIVMPFKRTPANIMEEGASRTPGLGFLADYLSGKNVSMREQIAQQAGGIGAGVAGYQAGQELDDPRSNTQNVARRVVTNAAGRYSLPAQIGLFLGQTVGQDKKISKQKMEQMLETGIPLPGVDMLSDIGYQAYRGITGEPMTTPRGFQPFRPFTDIEQSQPLSRYSQIRRR